MAFDQPDSRSLHLPLHLKETLRFSQTLVPPQGVWHPMHGGSHHREEVVSLFPRTHACKPLSICGHCSCSRFVYMCRSVAVRECRGFQRKGVGRDLSVASPCTVVIFHTASCWLSVSTRNLSSICEPYQYAWHTTSVRHPSASENPLSRQKQRIFREKLPLERRCRLSGHGSCPGQLQGHSNPALYQHCALCL